MDFRRGRIWLRRRQQRRPARQYGDECRTTLTGNIRNPHRLRVVDTHLKVIEPSLYGIDTEYTINIGRSVETRVAIFEIGDNVGPLHGTVRDSIAHGTAQRPSQGRTDDE